MKNIILFTSLLFSSFALSQKASFSDAEIYVLTSIGIDKPYPEYIVFAKESEPELFLPKDEFETTLEYKSRLQELKKQINKSRVEYAEEKKRREIVIKNSNKIKKMNSLKEFTSSASRIGWYDADNEYFNDFSIQFPSTNIGATTITRTTIYSLPSSPASNRNSKIKATIARGSPLVVLKNTGDFFYVKAYLSKSGFYDSNTPFVTGYVYGPYAKFDDKKFNRYKIYIPRNQARAFKDKIDQVIIKGYTQLRDDMLTYKYFNMVAIHPETGAKFPFGLQDDNSNMLVDKKKSIIPPELRMKVAFIEPNGNSFLDAEETGKIKISISNSGKGSAIGVVINLNSVKKDDQVIINLPKQILGEIEPGNTKTADFEVVALKGVKKVINEFTITIDEA